MAALVDQILYLAELFAVFSPQVLELFEHHLHCTFQHIVAEDEAENEEDAENEADDDAEIENEDDAENETEDDAENGTEDGAENETGDEAEKT